MTRRKCHHCGRSLDGIEATVWWGPRRYDLCHNDERSCYMEMPSPFDELTAWLGEPDE